MMTISFFTIAWFGIVVGVGAEQWFDEVGHADPPQFSFDFLSLLGLVPEEKHALGKFLRGTFCAEDGGECIGVVAGVPHLRADGHGGRGEVLDLFQLEIQALGDQSEPGHVFLMATGMAADEIGYDLLAQAFTPVDVIKKPLEVLKL